MGFGAHATMQQRSPNQIKKAKGSKKII